MVIMWGLTALAACRPWVDDWRTKEQNRLNSLYITSYHHVRVLVWTHKPSLYIRLHACSYSERPNPLYRDITLSELIDWLRSKTSKTGVMSENGRQLQQNGWGCCTASEEGKSMITSNSKCTAHGRKSSVWVQIGRNFHLLWRIIYCEACKNKGFGT